MRTRVMRNPCLVALAPLLFIPVIAWADSGVGVDTWRANKLDPTGGQATQALDPDGTSWLVPGQRRSPTGNLYGTPAEGLHPETLSVWQIYGTFDVGVLHSSGEKTALYDRYTRWPTNGPVFDFDVNAERPSDGSYAEVRGSRISAEDQYYEAVYGKAGAYKAEIFVRDMPNLLSTDAKSIFNGVGTSNLTLAAGLIPGASTPAQVSAVSAAAPTTSLGTERNKQGIALSAYLTSHWTAYLNASDEERKGTRPYLRRSSRSTTTPSISPPAHAMPVPSGVSISAIRDPSIATAICPTPSRIPSCWGRRSCRDLSPPPSPKVKCPWSLITTITTCT
jgi:hypothetical protein